MSTLKREFYVAAYGQSAKFRAVKYAILIPLFAAVYWWFGKEFLAWTLGVLLILALAVHFVFRYMTDGWKKQWWLYMPPEGLSDL